MTTAKDTGAEILPFASNTTTPAVLTPDGELEPAPEVFEGELLTDEQNAALEQRKGLRQLLPARVVLLVVQVRESPRGAVVWRGAVGATTAVHLVCQGFESGSRQPGSGRQAGQALARLSHLWRFA